MQIELEHYNITVLDFNTLFTQKFQQNIVDLLRSFNLTEKPIKNADVKKFFYHSLTYDLCETVLDNPGKKIMFVFNTTMINACDLTYYYQEDDIIQLLQKYLSRLEKMLPFKICMIDQDIFVLDNTDDKLNILLNGCIQHCNNIDSKNYTLQKIKKFAKTYDLTFLDKDYLNRFKTKQLTV
jgi:hypothetical protein